MSLKHSLLHKVTVLALSGCFSIAAWAETGGYHHSLNSAQDHDLVTANIPYRQAPIAAVALAQLQIALYRAKTRTEQTLCNGNWSPRGKAVSQSGPTPHKKDSGGDSSWQFQSLRQAHPLNCPDVSRAQFFLEMSRHLPAWVTIRPAGQLTAFNRGETYILPPKSVASR